jgi:hypothetical protein
MLDTSSAIRDRYVAVLNGNLSLNGKNVPVYAESKFATPPQAYVTIGTIEETNDDNNHKFFSVIDVNVDIFCQQYKRNDMSQVDSISSQILQILIPTPSGTEIGDANFEIHPIARTGIKYLSLESGQNYVARKIVTIRNLVNQK